MALYYVGPSLPKLTFNKPINVEINKQMGKKIEIYSKKKNQIYLSTYVFIS